MVTHALRWLKTHTDRQTQHVSVEPPAAANHHYRHRLFVITGKEQQNVSPLSLRPHPSRGGVTIDFQLTNRLWVCLGRG